MKDRGYMMEPLNMQQVDTIYPYRNEDEKYVAELLAISGAPPLDFDEHEVWHDENGNIFIGKEFPVAVPDSPLLMSAVAEYIEEKSKRRTTDKLVVGGV